MKLQREPIAIDLYVSSKQMTEKERKELSEFIEKVKQKNKAKKNKKAA
jgi:hypothetical protein